MRGNLKPKNYLGLNGSKRDVFRALCDPTPETHGKYYAAVVGPFRTRAAAEFMRDHGGNNPHCRCVADAERIVRTLKNQSVLANERIKYLNKDIWK